MIWPVLSLLDAEAIVADEARVELALSTREDLLEAGLPTGTTTADAVASFGIRRWFEFNDVVDLGECEVAGLPAARWYHPTSLFAAEATHYFSSEFWLDDDVRRGHALVVDRLAAQFGPSEDSSASNTIENRWWRGDILITARSFPPDQQSAGHRNQLWEAFPELARATTVHIEFAVPVFAFNDVLAARVDAARFVSVPEAFVSIPNAQHLRRHASTRPSGVRIWADDHAVGITNREMTALVDRTPATGLRLSELTPARGGGYADLTVEADAGPSLHLARSGRFDALRPLAAEIAKQTGIALEVVQEPDE